MELHCLEKICNIEKGTSITKAKTTPGDIPVIAGGKKVAYYHNKSNREANTITISASGANAGFVNYFKELIFASDCITLKSKDENTIITDFIYLFLKSKQNEIYKLQSGAGQPHVYARDIAKIHIPIFSIETQHHIVKILDQADALRQKRKQAIELLDDYVKSVFLEMFGDPKINLKKFPLKRLKELYIDNKNGTKCGPFGSALKKDEFVDQGIPVWNMDNISMSGDMVLPFRMWISPKKYTQLESYLVINKDVLISRAGTVGKMCVSELPAQQRSIISTNLIRVRFGNKLLPEYFVSLMKYCKSSVGRLKTGADGSFTHMNTGVLDDLIFPYPPLEIQNKFLSIKKKTDSIKQKMIEQSQELDTQFEALMQKAFRGEL